MNKSDENDAEIQNLNIKLRGLMDDISNTQNVLNKNNADNQNLDEKNSIAKFFDKHLEKANIDMLDNGYSIGFCIGCFIANVVDFLYDAELNTSFDNFICS